jgi:TPR repeat protein
MWTFKRFEEGIQNHDPEPIMIYDVINSVLKTMRPIDKAGVRWYKAEARAGDPRAQFILAVLHHMGEEVNYDLKKAYNLYRKASEGGLPQAKFILGLLHHSQKSSYTDPEKAAKYFFEAADSGLAAAQLYAAFEYQSGKVVERDRSKAVDFFKKAADQNLSIAECLLGMHYYFGDGIDKNNCEAYKYFYRSAEKHHHTSQHYLGLMYYRGEAFCNEGRENIFTFISPFEPLNTPGHYRLGAGLAERRRMHFNLLAAFKLFESAAEKGNKEAMARLAEMLLLGEGAPKDETMAEKWRLRAEEETSDD